MTSKTRGERREQKRKNQRKMRVTGKQVFALQRLMTKKKPKKKA